MEKKIKHLELLQNVIDRMTHNSFLLKGWSVVLVSALFALSAKDKSRLMALVAYFPALSFWLLDGYFLWQERSYRMLYNKVRMQKEEEIDFSMNTSEFTCDTSCWFHACLSPTLLAFHGVVLATISIVGIVI